MLIDRLKREAAARELDESHRTGGTGRMALEPLVDRLVGDTQVRVVGKCLDVRETPKSPTHRPNSVSQREGSRLSAPSPECQPGHRPALEGSRGSALSPVRIEDVPPPKDKGGARGSEGDRRGGGILGHSSIAVGRCRPEWGAGGSSAQDSASYTCRV